MRNGANDLLALLVENEAAEAAHGGKYVLQTWFLLWLNSLRILDSITYIMVPPRNSGCCENAIFKNELLVQQSSRESQRIV